MDTTSRGSGPCAAARVSGNGRLATVFPGVAAVVLGEAMTLVAIGGGVVILLGVWLVNRRAFT